ncbi:MAG TPA: type II secretion system F family protein [Stellaceae bacterium]|nr:type II secretion system F family protein [Stellaceae bacterium]
MSGLTNLWAGFGDNGLAILGALAVLATLVMLGHALLPDDSMTARVRSHLRRRDHLRQDRLQVRQRIANLRNAPIGNLRTVLARLKLLSGSEARGNGDLLTNAGWRARDALTVFMGLRLALPAVFGLGTLALLITQDHLPMMARMTGTVGGAVAGAYAPLFVLRRLIKRRQNLIRRQLPDALDLLVICAEAGLSLDAGLTRVARDLGPAAPQLGDELGLTAVELGFLPNRRQALQNLAKRTDLPAIRGVVQTLTQTERYGTPLAQALRVLAAEFREERLLKAEEKAARLPATLTVPMIIFILPTLFVVLIGPAMVRVVENFL